MTRYATMLLLLAVAPALAQLPPGRPWRDPHQQKELGLTKEQVASLEDIHRKDRDRLVDLRAAMEKKHMAVEDAFESEPFDEAAARTAQAGVEAAQSDLARAEGARLIAMRKILTLEQFRKLGALRPPMPPHGPGHAPMPPMPPGPPRRPHAGPPGNPEPPDAPEPPSPPGD